ncbi:protein translocase subunit SecD, partial [candidate division WWE3 bacterium CG_4_8_14_3_um_filter_42_11]
ELTPEADPADQTIYYNPEVWQNVDVSGADLKGAQVVFSQQTGKPQVQLLFTDEGRAKFSEVVKRNVGKPVGIFLDGLPLSMPRVDPDLAQGLTGDPVITGQFDVTEAKNLSIQLDAGALPVNLKLVQQENVGATLGRESVRKSLVAGIIGLILVMFFMWAYYGKKGFLADIALFIYGLITLALYKLIPVTLTLAGMAGFILAIGMAVDANILIFERIKEELRWGKPLSVALELGFGRAWDSIRDANINTLIVAFILFNPFDWGFLNTSGPVRGFALTLALGIFVSLFTGIVVTRTLLRLVYGK